MAYKVVVADDELIMRKAMQTLIDWEKLDCQLVYVASNGQEVMQELDIIMPDILILDIKMPGISGIDLAKYVWEHKLPCKVILLTAYADFSYAQSAIKYDVVDYVVKTGTFEEMVVAVEKAKESIEKTRQEQAEKNHTALRENFFKSVFDGTLEEGEELEKRAKDAEIVLEEGYLVAVIHFRMNEEEKRDYAYQSLQNFLQMVFEEQMVFGMAIRKNLIVVVLSDAPALSHEDIQKKCLEVIEMMDNFMKMHVYIGVSSPGSHILEIKKAYDEAEYAVGESFFNEKSKINYYHGQEKDSKESLENMEKRLEELQHWIRKGTKEEALSAFHEIIACQKELGGSVNTILEVGIRIYVYCKKLVADYDITVYDITPYKSSIVEMIYQCRHVSEYVEIMNVIIGNTSEYISNAVSRKNVLICECEKYIEENYQKCITVSEISRSIGVSLSYLSRIFKEETGNTIIHFINQKKIEKAKEYLDHTDRKIYEIAEALGFENTTYFSSFFKKHTGVSPKEYKENAI